MSLVCYDGKNIACDGLVTSGGFIIGRKAVKFFSVNDCWVMATGAYTDINDTLTALVGNTKRYPLNSNGNLLADFPKDCLDVVEIISPNFIHYTSLDGENSIRYRADVSRFAIGIADDYAVGCMDAGKTAMETVAIAIKSHNQLGGKISCVKDIWSKQ